MPCHRKKTTHNMQIPCMHGRRCALPRQSLNGRLPGCCRGAHGIDRWLAWAPTLLLIILAESTISRERQQQGWLRNSHSTKWRLKFRAQEVLGGEHEIDWAPNISRRRQKMKNTETNHGNDALRARHESRCIRWSNKNREITYTTSITLYFVVTCTFPDEVCFRCKTGSMKNQHVAAAGSRPHRKGINSKNVRGGWWCARAGLPRGLCERESLTWLHAIP